MNDKEKIVSFESESSERKKAVRLLIIETIIGVVIIAVIIGALNYFGLFPLKTIMSTFLGTGGKSGVVPAQRGYGPEQNTATLPEEKAEPTIPFDPNSFDVKAVSDMPDYKISLINKEGLIQVLKDWNVFGRTYNFAERGSTENSPLTNITVHLIDKPQVLNVVNVDNKIAFSSDVKVSKGKLDIFVYLAPFVLSGDKGYTLSKGEYFSDQMLITLFRIAHQTKSSEEQRALDQQMISEIRALKEKYNSFVNLEKK